MRPKLTCWSCGGVFVDVGRQPLACPRCGAQPGVVPEFPKSLLDNVAWSFADKQPKDTAALRATITEHYATVYGKPPPPDHVYDVRIPSCRVVLEAFKLAEPILIEQTAPFTAGELLLATHRVLAPKLRHRDHHFFEGFTLKVAEPDKPPVYSISIGS
jgi:hypothetical protein